MAKKSDAKRRYIRDDSVKAVPQERLLPLVNDCILNGLKVTLELSRIAQFGLEKRIVTVSIVPETWCEKANNPTAWCSYAEGTDVQTALGIALAKLPEDLTEDTVFLKKESKSKAVFTDPSDWVKAGEV